MLNHQLQNPCQLRRPTHVDEVHRHHIGNDATHQVVIPWNHMGRRQGKAGKKIELCHEPDDAGILLNRISVEIVLPEQILELPHGHITRHGLDRSRHIVGNNIFKKFIQGTPAKFEIPNSRPLGKQAARFPSIAPRRIKQL